MAYRTVALPLFLLGDDELNDLAERLRGISVLTGSDPQSDAAIIALADEWRRRHFVVVLNDDGTFTQTGSTH